MRGPKQRPRPAGPRKRRYGGGGPGRPFRPGTNNHNSQVFRRGPDRIPRGTIDLLYRTILNDDGDLAAELLAPKLKDKLLPFRRALARSLILAANDPRQALAAAETIACRLEGRPVQKFEAGVETCAVFYQQGDPPPWLGESKALSTDSHNPRTGSDPGKTDRRRSGPLVDQSVGPDGLTVFDRERRD